jgi:hypothetical protein
MFEHLDDTVGFVPSVEFRQGVMERGRRLRARRRLTAAIGGAIAVASALVAVLALISGPRPDEDTIVIEPTPLQIQVATSTIPPAPEAPVAGMQGLEATPTEGLRDGDTVTLRFPTPIGSAMLLTCAAEAVDYAGDNVQALARCGDPWLQVEPTAEATVTVQSVIRTEAGIVDCSSAPGRCIVVASAGPSDFRYAPLSFAPLPPDEEASEAARIVVAGVYDSLGDGDTVRIGGYGFQPGQALTIAQCRDHADCDAGGRDLRVLADEDGRFETDFTVFHDIGRLTPIAGGDWRRLEWSACSPCLLRVWSDRQDFALPIGLADDDHPIRPRIEIDDDNGPFAPGEKVRIEGSGFQPGDAPPFDVRVCSLAWWDDPAVLSMDRGTLVDDPAPDGCVALREGSQRKFGVPGGFVVDEDGQFVIDDFPLPGPRSKVGGTSCAQDQDGCAVTWMLTVPWVMPSSAMGVPLDLSG